MSTGITGIPPIRPLDPALYHLDEQESAFYKSQTGIISDEELKTHILAVQEEAYNVFPYPCIQRFAFTKLKISRLPGYDHFLRIGQEHEHPVFLDIGCCFGNDARKAVADGFPIDNVIASDLLPEFWDLGHKLFNSTPETFPVPFLAGDAFDPAFISPSQPFYSHPSSNIPPLSSLTSLTPLQGHVGAIHASAFFHLFDEEKQFALAQRLASLLSPQPGSIIFGAHGGREVKGIETERVSSRGEHKFCHSPESWKELWDGQIFEKGAVRVEARLGQAIETTGGRARPLEWSAIRL